MHSHPIARSRAASRCRAAVLMALGALLAVAVPDRAASEPAARIVALGGAVTEILYELGAGARIVAVDTTSVHPAEALATKPNVGYLRQLSAEGILSARPSLVIAVDGAGPPDALKLVRDAGVPIRTVPEETTEAGVAARIEAVAKAVGEDAKGKELAEGARARFASLAALRKRIDRRVRALFILSVQNGRSMVGGRNTSADGMLQLAGAENVAASIEGFKPMTDEAILAARPDVVVMMSSGPGGHASDGVLDGPALSQTPAGRDRRLVTMNGLYLLGFGPRTPEAARDLMIALYPGMKAE